MGIRTLKVPRPSFLTRILALLCVAGSPDVAVAQTPLRIGSEFVAIR